MRLVRYRKVVNPQEDLRGRSIFQMWFPLVGLAAGIGSESWAPDLHDILRERAVISMWDRIARRTKCRKERVGMSTHTVGKWDSYFLCGARSSLLVAHGYSSMMWR